MVHWVLGEEGGARDGLVAKCHCGKGASEAQNLLTASSDLNPTLRREEGREEEKQAHGSKLCTEENMVFPLPLLTSKFENS